MTQDPWHSLQYRTLLFPTDGSRDSHVAVLQLVPLALASGAAVLALEVIESRAQVLGRASAAGWLPAGDGFLTDENAQGLVDVQHRAAEDHLQAIQRELERAGIERVACLVEEGQPGPVIVQVAERDDCDAIVMSTRGRSGLSRLLLGSVAEYVARNASCPVVLVPASSRRPSGRRRRTQGDKTPASR